MTMLAVLGIVIAVVVIAAVVRHARRSARTGNRLSSAWEGLIPRDWTTPQSDFRNPCVPGVGSD
jgi:hypothetical protein